MAIVTLITAAAHLIQIALWAVAFLVCGQVSTFETAFCLSAQNFTAFGYGAVMLSERWRLLSPLEATNGLLFFGISTAVLFAIMSSLIANRLRIETGYPSEAAGNQAPFPVAGDARSR
ncbi:MAG: ion channel [Isosphaerales bacterium]